MKVIVSKEKIGKKDGYNVVDNFSIIENDIDNLEVLIYNSSNDDLVDVVFKLSNLKDKNVKLIYINKNIDPLLYTLFKGLDGDVIDNEDVLYDVEIINFIVDNYKNTGMSVKDITSDVETISKSLELLSQSDKDKVLDLLKNKFWLKKLDNALMNIETSVARNNVLNKEIVTLVEDAKNLVNKLKEWNENTNLELENTLRLIEDMEYKSRTNSPYVFSSYTVPVSVQKVMYVKVYGMCKYLNSFILSYLHYLKNHKGKKVKCLFVLPKFKLILNKFENVARLAPDSVDIMDFNVSDYYVTYDPKKVVLDSFFSQNANLNIVVDYSFDVDDLIKGYNITKFYAVGSKRDIDKFGLNPNYCISSITTYYGCMTISFIKGYQKEDNELIRQQLYFKNLKDVFERLNNLLGV